MSEEHDESGPSTEGSALAPNELDIADDEHVRFLGDNRYVISADKPIGRDDPTDAEPDRDDRPPTGEEPALDSATVHDWLADQLSTADARYGFDITARFDGTVASHRLRADDVVTVFDALVYWYAGHLDAETPIEEALGILLMESNVPVRYPADTVYALTRAHDLDPEDTVADLLEAVRGDGQVRFPPE